MTFYHEKEMQIKEFITWLKNNTNNSKEVEFVIDLLSQFPISQFPTRVNENIYELIKLHYPQISVKIGHSIPRTIHKILNTTGICDHPNYNRQYAILKNAIYPPVIKQMDMSLEAIYNRYEAIAKQDVIEKLGLEEENLQDPRVDEMVETVLYVATILEDADFALKSDIQENRVNVTGEIIASVYDVVFWTTKNTPEREINWEDTKDSQCKAYLRTYKCSATSCKGCKYRYR